MDSTTAFHPLDYISVVRRRLWWLVVPIVLALLIGAALITFLPRTYKTQAIVGVTIPAMSQELLSTAQRVTADERLRSIRQVLLGQPVLERVAREEGFDRAVPIGEAVAKLRSRIETTFPRPEAGVSSSAAFSEVAIAYSDGEPGAAQRVANRLAEVFVQETSASRAIRAEETSMFIGQQLQRSSARLAELEDRLKQAKEASMGALPEQTHANVAMVTSLQQQLQDNSNRMASEQERLNNIERQLENLRSGASAAAAPGGSAIPSSATGRVAMLERDLAAKLGTYTESHPEVVRLRDELAAAKAEEAAEAARPVEDRMASLRTDPFYATLISDRDAVSLRLNTLRRQEEGIRRQIETYRSRVELAPQIEQQMQALNREYLLEKDNYTNLTNKLRNAETSENLVRNGGGEEFAVLSYAPFPSTPDSPATGRILIFSVLLGVCFGGGLALGREYLDRSIHDARALSDLDLPVLGEIPRIANA